MGFWDLFKRKRVDISVFYRDEHEISISDKELLALVEIYGLHEDQPDRALSELEKDIADVRLLDTNLVRIIDKISSLKVAEVIRSKLSTALEQRERLSKEHISEESKAAFINRITETYNVDVEGDYKKLIKELRLTAIELKQRVLKLKEIMGKLSGKIPKSRLAKEVKPKCDLILNHYVLELKTRIIDLPPLRILEP